MPITRKPLEIPPEVSRQFADDMQAFHAERDPLKRDEIAANTGTGSCSTCQKAQS
ncbi:hypothetical protein [Bradyrhizobium sp. 6(2017)]|uniref:hypothetical protein n=1 Tax=Bradyrhizobium sp. 6(2017) TaxID=1197460 RepID=UPI0013E18503|nr:hypothetical protein [Bradyrhizobium sp. 6(2017)]QIG92079.1 hypothetical protein G6P99_05890 [Bradyrhizobium sp. 6(2017)]